MSDLPHRPDSEPSTFDAQLEAAVPSPREAGRQGPDGIAILPPGPDGIIRKGGWVWPFGSGKERGLRDREQERVKGEQSDRSGNKAGLPP